MIIALILILGSCCWLLGYTMGQRDQKKMDQKELDNLYKLLR